MSVSESHLEDERPPSSQHADVNVFSAAAAELRGVRSRVHQDLKEREEEEERENEKM